MTARIVILSLSIGLLANMASAQTISERDLEYFAAAVSIPNPNVPHSLDVTHFADYYIDSTDSRGERNSEYSPPPNDRHRVWFVVDAKPVDLDGYYFATMAKLVNGPEEGPMNLLTVWKWQFGRKFALSCIHRLEEGDGYTTSRVVSATRFPDSSILLQIEYMGGDGTLEVNNAFLRGSDSCSYQTFYSLAWSSEEPIRKEILDEKRTEAPYKRIAVTEYLTIDSSREGIGDAYAAEPDSVSGQVIDLWQLAVQKFGIDTTKISRDH